MNQRDLLAATIRANRTKLAFLNNETEERLGMYLTPADITIAKLESEIQMCKAMIEEMNRRDSAAAAAEENRLKARGAS